MVPLDPNIARTLVVVGTAAANAAKKDPLENSALKVMADVPPATKATAATAVTAVTPVTPVTPPVPSGPGATAVTAVTPVTPVTAVTALTYAVIDVADLPLSNQPQQLKASASHKAAATPVAGRFVGYPAPAATTVVKVLVIVVIEPGAAKLIQ